MYEMDFSTLLKNYPMIIEGILTTISVSLLAGILAFVLGSFFAYFRTSPLNIISKITNFIVLFIRNMPLLILIYLFYKGLPSIHLVLSAYACGILALGLYTGCYISDAIISGINAVPKEHFQASQSLGMSRIKSFIYIIYPQATRYVIPILGNQFMSLVKNSSLVSFIAVTDIFYVVYKGISDTYRIYEYFILAVVLYLFLTGFVLLLTKILQKIYRIPSQEVIV
ncbi:MAG TPA: amino acid ABC transporter permease [Candidatus Gastranaerophilaceae bacterium]|nr:amino acid ABC transporter permease [Candidatus Gastranaerophilaceae bacterium]